METTWLQITTLVIAVIGAVLGVLNTWRTFNNDRVRVRVKASWAWFPRAETECLCIEVVNFSSFPITITHIGFTQRGVKTHMQLMGPMLSTGDQLPKRLESRASFTAFAAPGATEIEGFAIVDRPYVSTACGLRIMGSRRALATAIRNLALARR